jgi:hypothetical protein
VLGKDFLKKIKEQKKYKKLSLSECQQLGTRQRMILPSAKQLALGKL